MVGKRTKYRSRTSDRYISGKTGLELIDSSVGQARTALEDAIRSADEMVQRRGDIRKEQAEAFLALAQFRLDVLKEDNDTEDLSKAELRAEELLAQHADFVAKEHVALQSLVTEIETLEEERNQQSLTLKQLVEGQEALIDKTLSELASEPAYQDLHKALEQAGAVTERAVQKLALAQSDRDEKGRPYEDDPFFSYLWDRKYQTVNYKSRGLVRMLDNWVAKLCGYDKAHLTYARLTELPDRLAEHVGHVEALEVEAEAELKVMEATALEKGGADSAETEMEEIRGLIRRLDEQVEATEETHLARSQSHQDALYARKGPAEEARQILATALRKLHFPDLRILVAQTVELEDDRIVDGLVKLRAEEMQLDLLVTDQSSLPKRRGYNLKQAEALRKGYKRASYASNNLLIDRSTLEDVLSDIRSNTMDVQTGLKRIRKTIKRVNTGQRRPYHRGRRSRRAQRDTAYGIEDVAGTVAWELAKVVISAGSGARGGGIDLDDIGGGSDDGGGFKTGGRF